MKNSYAADLQWRARWLIETFGTFADDALERYMNEHVGLWGAEFDRLSALNDLEL